MLKSLFNWKVLLNIVLAIGVFVGLVWLTFRWLEIHTQHGQEIQVPNVMNKSVQDAIKIFDDAGLDYEVDSMQFNPKYKPFQVLKVSPMPGARVKSGRAVRILVNPRTWAKVSVPDIMNRYKGLAFRQLEQVGLKVGDTIFEPSIQRDAVLRMLLNGKELKPGTLIPRFTSIDVVIGTGPRRNIPVPNVVGLTVAQAKAIISQNLFELGIVEYEDGKGNESDIVYYQDPGSHDLRDQGMQIDLWASKKTPAELSGKINMLNSMYRMKLDTTLPPVRYEEYVPVDKEPSISQPAKPKVDPPAEVPKATVTTGAATKPATTTPKVETPKSSTPKETKPSTAAKTEAPAEKAKVRKIVIE